ncbi:hypothetical protein SAMN05216464_11179 [Mucilaginibacter pineti]|uniref:Uncharacterized protein n=1 Tax=Mucilaginibacter pineti TaxID=1391627 RepID=A0A1G7H784_9SPHI|nr:hypothetical protein [Mucilaginibacter pineti]SDE95979.1 hypothetical protein SAMN05216464_11179 [Mucilaginibacter pineti]
MKIQITPTLIDFLIKSGYHHCYSRTTLLGMKTCITLTPVKKTPRLKFLPLAYDTYFQTKKEPVLMAQGIDDDTVVVIDTGKGGLKSHESFFTKKFEKDIWKV